ncbi:MAG TPA: SsrA-binding protein SmpB [Chloroflexota bacterium]|nr:SsrA-binding protein SmpB [Chloroflexota bacterium]
MPGKEKQYANNPKAFHDYHILETVEAGIALTGTEVKSVRAGRVSLREAYARIERGEAWLLGAHIAPYAQGNRYNHEPTRPRKLLLHRGEIGYLAGKTRESGVTLVPLRLYDRGGHIKVELGLARGKKQWDKRQAIAQREARREIDRAMKEAVRA